MSKKNDLTKERNIQMSVDEKIKVLELAVTMASNSPGEKVSDCYRQLIDMIGD